MINDRVVLVGIVWTLVLIGLLVVREFLRAMDGPTWKPAIRATNIMVVVMVVAAGLAGALRLTALATPPPRSGIASPSPSPTPPRASVRPTPTPSPVTGPTATASAVPAPSPTPTATGASTPTPTASTSPTPGTSPTPTASPTPPVTDSPAPTAGPTGGRVTAGPSFRAYELERDGQVGGFRDVRAARRFTADTTSPAVFPFPSLGDPDGTVRLVRLLSGPFVGAYLDPDDPGVTFRPAGS